MAKPRALNIGITLGVATASAAVALLFRLPKAPDENNLLGLIGSLIGAAVAVVAGLLILARQFETTDERHLRTVRHLLGALKDAGTSMTTEAAPLDPPTYAGRALSALQTAQSVTRELQATGPNIAAVAQMLWESGFENALGQLANPHLQIGGPGIQARGQEIVSLADRTLEKLKDGL